MKFKNLKILFIILIFLFLVNHINASPPKLPVLVYGKVILKDEEIPIPNLLVRAVWSSTTGLK